ncbi:MAG TPA: response regulator [Chloroflexota bacterium]|nr:response regulator [Chloroflexota bacterium]
MTEREPEVDARPVRRVLAPADLPDLLFLDVSMPTMGGLDVLARVRAQRLDAAVIIVTAHGSEGVAIDAMRRGADDYLRKPFTRDEFLGVLERTVSRLDLRRQNAALRGQLDERRRQLEAELARAAQSRPICCSATRPTCPDLMWREGAPPPARRGATSSTGSCVTTMAQTGVASSSP